MTVRLLYEIVVREALLRLFEATCWFLHWSEVLVAAAAKAAARSAATFAAATVTAAEFALGLERALRAFAASAEAAAIVPIDFVRNSRRDTLSSISSISSILLSTLLFC